MLKKSITYKTLDGEELTEEFYFNLNKAELVELELSQKGGFSEAIKKIIASNNSHEIVPTFKKIILDSYGVKSDDGKRFIKGPELRTAFEQTEAFSNLFFELATNAGSAAEFINGIVPSELKDLMPIPDDEEPSRDVIDAPLPEPVKEAKDMSREELLAAFNAKVKSQQDQ